MFPMRTGGGLSDDELPDPQSNSFIYSNRQPRYFHPKLEIESKSDLTSHCTLPNSDQVSKAQEKVRSYRAQRGEKVVCGRHNPLYALEISGLTVGSEIFSALSCDFGGSLFRKTPQVDDEHPTYTCTSPHGSADLKFVSLSFDRTEHIYTALFEPPEFTHNEIVMGLMKQQVDGYTWLPEEYKKRGYTGGNNGLIHVKIQSFSPGWLQDEKYEFDAFDGRMSWGYFPSANRVIQPHIADPGEDYKSIPDYIREHTSSGSND